MENKKYHTVGTIPKSNIKIVERGNIDTSNTVGTIPKSNIKIVERGNIDTSNTKIYDQSLSWLCTGTFIKKWRG
jgi:hypothetical protein